MNQKLKYLTLTLLFIAPILAYFPSLRYGFSQDDFIHLAASQAKSFFDVINFFNPLATFPDIFFYRPLTTQTFFFINHSLFGLNPLPFHITGLLLHVCSVVLFYILIKKLFRGFTENYNRLATVCAVFYGVSAVHFLSLYYISAFQQIGRTFFLFATMYFFIRYQESKRYRDYFLSILLFVLALLSKETAVILPLLLFPVEMLRSNVSIIVVLKDAIRKSIPYVSVALVYSAVRFLGFQTIFSKGAYEATFSITHVLQNLKWYVLWVFGLPELLASYPSLGIASLKQFASDYPLAPWILFLFVVTIFTQLFVFDRMVNRRFLLSSVLLFLIPLLPVLVLSQHRYPQYLDISLVGFLPVFCWFIVTQSTSKKLVGSILLVSFVGLQLASLSLSEKTHWTTHRSEVAAHYLTLIRQMHPSLPNNTTLIFDGNEQSSREVSVALAKSYAPKLWYPEVIAQVFYKPIDVVSTDTGVITIPITKY